jgi:predicted nucleic acid-binding protein
MRKPRCTIDSSCVIALDHVNLLDDKLSWLFSEILIPKAVRDDLFKRRNTKNRIKALFAKYHFIQPCDAYDKGAVDILLLDQTREGKEDRGEAETVVQASQFGATVIVDDSWGKTLAERHGLVQHGTFWILKQFLELELISTATFRDSLVALHKRRIWFPWDVVNESLIKIGEAPIKIR